MTSRSGTRWLMCLWALAAALWVLPMSAALAQQPAVADGGVLLVDIKGGIGPATRRAAAD